MENKNPHAGHRQRLRAMVMENGLDGLHEHQVLEYLLSFVVPQKDTNVLAHNLINRFGSFYNIFDASINQLTEVNGVGEVLAHFLFSFKDFVAYYKKQAGQDVDTITDPFTAKIHARKLLKYKPVEEVYLTIIDANNKVIQDKRIARGTANKAIVDVRAISDEVFASKASNVMLCHNHPHGKPLPSPEDDKLTRALYFVLELNNIKFLDHIIVGEDSEYSYVMDNKFNKYKNNSDMILDATEARFNARMGYIAQGHAKYNWEGADNED